MRVRVRSVGRSRLVARTPKRTGRSDGSTATRRRSRERRQSARSWRKARGEVRRAIAAVHGGNGRATSWVVAGVLSGGLGRAEAKSAGGRSRPHVPLLLFAAA